MADCIALAMERAFPLPDSGTFADLLAAMNWTSLERDEPESP